MKIKVKAYWVPLSAPDKPVVNAFFILDISFLWWSRSVCFHIHLKDIDIKKNPIVIEHGYGEPNLHEYQTPGNEIREKY